MKSSFNGGTTGATILNTGETTSTVNLDFSVTNISSSGLNADGDPCGNSIGDPASDEVSIGPGSSVVVNAQQDNIGGLDSCTFFAMTASISGTVTSDGHIGIVLTVNENRTYQGETVKAVYAGANTATSANTVFVPLYKEDFNGNTTGATVVNVGTSPAFITGTFTADDGSIYTLVTADEIDPGSAAAFFRPGSTNADNFTSTPEDLPDGEKYSVVFNSSQPIEALVQESDRNFDNGILDISNYEGFKN